MRVLTCALASFALLAGCAAKPPPNAVATPTLDEVLPPAPAPRARLEDTTLPEVLQDCFVVARDRGAMACTAGPSSRAGDDDAAGLCERLPAGCASSAERAVRLEPCPKHPPPLGSIYCFTPDRVFHHSPSEPSETWQQFPGEWRSRGRHNAEGEATFYGNRRLALRPSGRDAILSDRFVLVRADASMRAELRLVPRVENVCERTKACLVALERARRKDDRSPAVFLRDDDDQTCIEIGERAKASFAGTIPKECTAQRERRMR